MQIMPSRYEQLRHALAGLQQTGVPLINCDRGMLNPGCTSDDCGIYFLIPRISQVLGIPLDQAIDTFFLSVIVLSFLLGCAGFFLVFRNWISRIIAWLALSLLSLLTYLIGDVYVICAAAVVSVVPLFLSIVDRRRFGSSVVLAALLGGFLAGAAHVVRSQSGTAVLIFMVILLAAGTRYSKLQKLSLVFVLIAGLLLPIGFFGHLVSQRDAYLHSRVQHYHPEPTGHPFWHSVYIGLGFVNNDYVVKYLDEVAIDRVRQIDPNARFLSAEYNAILRMETLRIVKKDPYFVFLTIGAKTGVMMLYVLLFSNLGLVFAFSYRKGCRIELAFWAGIVFSALPGILAIPHYNYLLGLIAFATLYGIVGIHAAIEGGFFDHLKARTKTG